ncbi:MAG: TonB-dependent receptor [Pseudomonadota bacterium]
MNEESFGAELAITPSRLPQRLDESPSPITVIDRDMLRASGVRRLADILRMVPGMVVGTRSPAIQPATYLGLSDDYSRRIQVLVDGVSIYAPSIGAVLWQDLPIAIDDIERIEVVRGPNTAAYGSHALLATVKIITVKPREVARWGGSANVGSNGVRDVHARLASEVTGGAWMLSYLHQEDDGQARLPDYRGGRRLDGVRLRGDQDLSAHADLQWELAFARAENGLGNALESDVSAAINDSFRDENNHQFLTLRHRPSAGDEWVLRLARNAQQYKEPFAIRLDRIHQPGEPFPTSLEEFLAETEPLTLGRNFHAVRYEAELENHVLAARDLRGVWGLGLRREEVEGELFFGEPGPQRQDSARLFGHLEWRIAPDWLLNGGAMVENSSISETVFSPRLALIHHLTPSHTLRLSWNTGIRQPLLFENQGRTATWQANGEPVWLTRASGSQTGGLDAERASEWSLGYHWAPNRAVQWDMRAYHMRIDDTIRPLMRLETEVAAPLYPVGGFFLPLVLDTRNVGSLDVYGIEAQLDARLGRDTRLHVNYALAEARERETLQSDWPDYAASIPRHTAGVMLTHRFNEAWDASLRMHYTDSMRWAFLTRDELEASHSINLRLGYTRSWGGERLRLDLIGENLDGDLHDFGLQRGWGRTIWLRVGLEST